MHKYETELSFIFIAQNNKGLILHKLISSALTLAVTIMFLTPTLAEAKSKKYYQYILKARPTSFKTNFFNGIGDHTYVCIKERKKKHGKYKTIKNYGCHNQFGSTSRGREVGRWIVKKTRTSKRYKNGALKISHKWYCRMIYAVGGVCHQDSNRVLYGARNWRASTWNRAKASIPLWVAYGKYGKGWYSCKGYAYNR